MFSSMMVTALATVLMVIIAQLRRNAEYCYSCRLRDKASHCTIEDSIAASLAA